MTAAVALARAELAMLLRNRAAAATAIGVPLGGGLWVATTTPQTSPVFASPAGIAALQVLLVVAMTVITTATTTLVARRQQLLLERWRTSPAPTPAVLGGTLAPTGLLFILQCTILLVATAIAADTVPAVPALVALAVVVGGAFGGAVAIATAATTRTVEAASVTVLPAMALLAGGGAWALQAPAGAVTWPMRVTGGGALVELVRVAWHGPDGAAASMVLAAAPPLLTLVLLTCTIGVVAARTFRWSPRT